ncbi:MAG: hypothetical protein VCC02_04735 [Myxococcota bacterium]
MPSVTKARGHFRLGYGSRLGAAGVPFGAAKIEEAEVGFFFSKDVRIDPKRHFGIPVAEL